MDTLGIVLIASACTFLILILLLITTNCIILLLYLKLKGKKSKYQDIDGFQTPLLNLPSDVLDSHKTLHTAPEHTQNIRIRSPQPVSNRLSRSFGVENHSTDLNLSIINAKPKLKDFWVDNLDQDIQKIELIGRGASSEVWKVQYHGAFASLKLAMLIDLLEDPMKDYVNEVACLAKCKHPNVLRILGCYVNSPHFYLLTEYCNCSLDSIVFKDNTNVNSFQQNQTILGKDTENLPTLDLKKSIELLREIASGMCSLASNGVVHRDLKLANLLLTTDQHIRICDFGVSIQLNEVVKKDLSLVGTIEICAPEILEDPSKYSIKSDVYSFGIVVYEMLTKSELYQDMNINQIKDYVIQGGRPSLEVLKTTLPESLVAPVSDLVMAMWNDSPDKRPNFFEIEMSIRKWMQLT